MILSDTEILAAMERGEIVIDPFDISQLGGNSYDVRLAPVLRVYATKAVLTAHHQWGAEVGDEILRYGQRRDWLRTSTEALFQDLDCAKEPTIINVFIPEQGLLLVPGILYLASTVEYTETYNHVPYLDGRSSVGRLGISIHVTAGRGDHGFRNHFTLEMSVVQPVRIYAGIKIGQLTYHKIFGTVERDYSTKVGTTYGKLERNTLPQPSRLWAQLQAERAKK